MTLTKKEKVEHLRKVGLLAGLSDRVLGTIASRAEVIPFDAGRYIVRQQQIGTGLYLITSGRVRVVRGAKELARLGPGDFFGELSILDQQPRTAHVIAEAPTVCLALASWDFIKILERNPKIAVTMLRELTRRLRRAEEIYSH